MLIVAALFARPVVVARRDLILSLDTPLSEFSGWIAPIATMIAALMTAANLGSRVTGWGFVVFTIGSISWCTVALVADQSNLLVTNGFLTLVNAVGIWRWLGRQARHDDSSAAATMRSAAARVPTLFGVGALVGGTVSGRDGAAIGTVVDGMMRCDGGGLAYVVIAEGGVGGLGERLHALHPDLLRFGEQITCDLDLSTLARLPVLAHDDWPATIDREAQI